jgi:acyl-homoserine lactone acylase PvdQ
MSNALLVSAKHSKTGSPLTVFGPQTGYYTPQLLNEQVLKGPGVLARGVSFAGTNLVVELGRGLDYAWSATSASLDNVDTVVERLCNTDGSPATVDSEGYLDKGKCVPMDHFEPSYTALPSAGSTQPPATYTYLVLRTRHGLVQTRTTVHGKPVAIVLQRSTYGHEVDSAVGFRRFNDPGYVHDARSFQRAAQGVDYTFNWFYTDDKDIAYYASGLIPKRSRDVAFDFPRWGDRAYDWNGYVGFKGHVRQINPPSGYLVSWNNRQAPHWAAPDDIWAWGSVHRSQALEDRIRAQIRGGRKIDITDAVGVMAGAAYQDSRARYTLPWLLKVIGKDPKTAEARRYLRGWLAAGAPRVDRDQDGAYSHQQAIAIFDDWWQDGDQSVAYDVMQGLLGKRLVHSLPQILDNHPRSGTGSSWLDSPWYSYLNKDLRTLVGNHVEQPLRYSYCGNGTLASCRKVLRASLYAAVQRVLSAQDVSDVADLTYDKTQDDIRSTTSGAVGVRPIDWQNRPTFQQVVEFLSHRPRS